MPVSAASSNVVALGSAPPVITIAAGSSAASIQAAINGASAGSRIVLSQGTYTFDKTVVLNKDGITLEGQGNVTIIAAKSLAGAPAIQVGTALFRETETNATKLTQAADEGATSLQVSSGAQLKVGDVLWIERPNDQALFTEIGDTKWQQDKPLRTAMVVVTAVNGSTVTLDRPLPFDFDAKTTTVAVADVVEDVTVKNLTLQGAYGTADPSNFNNIIAAEDGGMIMLVNASVGTVVQNVDIVQPASNGLVLGRSIDAVVDDVTVTGAQNKGDSGNGYGFWIRDVYDSSFTNLQAVDTRHAVLFASYTSAANNEIEVDFTNRDINFHGGLDRGNTIIVNNSIRTAAEQAYMAAVSFFNPGTSYGAPTDPTANIIKFTNVVGTVRADAVVATDVGATIATMSGNDSVAGGAGNDRIDMGTGTDLVLGSTGTDTIDGGQGVDTLVFDLDRSDVLITTLNGQTAVLSAWGHTFISNIEQLRFNDATTSAAVTTSVVVAASQRLDRIDVSTTSRADGSVQDVRLVGKLDVDFVGNTLGNKIYGNTAENILFGEGGNDTIYGGRGDDVLNGGTGDDRLLAGIGNDTLTGGSGTDWLFGGLGEDVFIAGTGETSVRDFQIAEQDRLVFFGYSDADLAESLTHYLAKTTSAADDFTISQVVRGANSWLTVTSDLGDSLVLRNVDAEALRDYLL